MPIFQYQAINDKGMEINGEIESDSQQAAAATLRGRRLSIMALYEGDIPVSDKQKLLYYLGFLNPNRYRRVKTVDLLVFFRQISMMLRSGHTVLEAIEAIEPMVSKHRLRKALNRVAERIQSGLSLSAAMEKEKVFPPIAVKLIESGEMTGELDAIMLRIADDMERNLDIKRKLIASMTYPTIVIFASIAVILFLVLGVIPKFATFLERRAKTLPPMTQRLMDVSAFFQDYGMYLGIISFIVVFGTLVAYTTKKGKFVIDRVLLKIPMIGGSIVSASMARSGWTLSMMIGSGLTIMDSIRLVAEVNTNAVLKKSFQDASDSLLQGQNLSGGLIQPGIPKIMVHLAGVGEKSGELNEVMEEMGKFYHKDLDARIRTMTGLIEPALTVIVGGMVGFVYIAFFQAVFAIANGGLK